MPAMRLAISSPATADPARPPAEMLPKRERGLWSFLTWSFFLSQVLAGEAFVGAGAHAAESAGSSHADPHGQTANHAGSLAALAGDSSTDAGASTGAGPHGNGAHPQVMVGQIDLAHGATPHIALDAGSDSVVRVSGGGVVAAAGDGSNILAAASGVAGETDGGGSVHIGIDLPDLVGDVGDTLSDVIETTLDQVVDPLLGAVGDLAQSLNAIVGGAVGDLASLLNVGQTTQVVVAALDDVVGTLGSTVNQVLAPIDGTVDQLVQSLGSTVDQTLAPIAGTLDSLLQMDIASGDSGLSSVVDPLSTSLLQPVVAPLAGALASAGAIVFPKDVVASADNLFLDGRYTDYNLALRSSVTSDASAGGDSIPGVPDLVDLIVSMDDHATGDAPPLGALHSLLDDIGLRSLGDGIV